MNLADILRERLDVKNQDAWENERTPPPVRCFVVRVHSVGSGKILSHLQI